MAWGLRFCTPVYKNNVEVCSDALCPKLVVKLSYQILENSNVGTIMVLP